MRICVHLDPYLYLYLVLYRYYTYKARERQPDDPGGSCEIQEGPVIRDPTGSILTAATNGLGFRV